MIKIILTSFIVLALSGCSTIHFDNGASSAETFRTEDWHHIGAISLVEFSSPVNTTEKCEGKAWTTVRTRKGPLQVLVGLVTGILYDPIEVSVACK
jgi:hypothetical protein